MNWLERLKNYQVPQTYATKPTEPGFVGSVAPSPGVLGNSQGPPGLLRQAAPNEAAVDGLEQHVVQQSCADCIHLLPRGTCAEPMAAGLRTQADGFGIEWPPEGQGTACPAFIGKMPLAAADRIQRLPIDDLDGYLASCWDDAEMAAFTARTARFALLGRADADELAERLTQRDRDGDDRRLCLECTWLGEKGRCLAAATGRIPGADRQLEPVQTILHLSLIHI